MIAEKSKLCIQGLKKTYNHRDLPALDDVTFSVKKGEIVAVMGASGSGKSTLLKAIAGVLKPTEGSVFYWGNSLWDMSPRDLQRFRREEIGFVEQDVRLVDILTAYENIILPLRLSRLPAEKDYLEKLIAKLRLGEVLRRYPRELSGGEKKRVVVARALIGRPAVLIADEPTESLDKKSAAEVMNLLLSASSNAERTVIFSTHDENFGALAERILTLSDGELVKERLMWGTL